MVPFIFMLLPVLLFFPVRTYADGWQPWQTAKEARIAWHYKWDKDWREYDVEIRNDYDHQVTVKFMVRCGDDKSVGFWSLKAGGRAAFLQRFAHGGSKVPLQLQIVDSYSN